MLINNWYKNQMQTPDGIHYLDQVPPKSFHFIQKVIESTYATLEHIPPKSLNSLVVGAFAYIKIL